MPLWETQTAPCKKDQVGKAQERYERCSQIFNELSGEEGPPKDWPGGRTNMPDFIGGPNLDSV